MAGREGERVDKNLEYLSGQVARLKESTTKLLQLLRGEIRREIKSKDKSWRECVDDYEVMVARLEKLVQGASDKLELYDVCPIAHADAVNVDRFQVPNLLGTKLLVEMEQATEHLAHDTAQAFAGQREPAEHTRRYRAGVAAARAVLGELEANARRGRFETPTGRVSRKRGEEGEGPNGERANQVRAIYSSLKKQRRGISPSPSPSPSSPSPTPTTAATTLDRTHDSSQTATPQSSSSFSSLPTASDATTRQ